MRITGQMSYQLMSNAVLGNQQAIYETQQQISSGKRVARPEDDPVDFERLARVRESLAGVQRYSRSIAQAQSELATVDNALQKANTLFQRAQELAVQASDGTKSAEERKAAGEEVDSLLAELISVANTMHDGHTIFSGLRGSPTTYEATDADGDGRLDTIAYQGGSGVRNVAVSPEADVAVGIPGTDTASSQAVFQTDTLDLFATMKQFRDRLLNGDEISGTDTISQLQTCQDHVLGVLAVVGGRAEALRFNSESLSKRETELTNNIDDLESLDVAKGVMTLTNKQQAYQAALSATANLSKDTLLNWLR
jgi:flagellar hook-associated protein 3 FlgL